MNKGADFRSFLKERMERSQIYQTVLSLSDNGHERVLIKAF